MFLAVLLAPGCAEPVDAPVGASGDAPHDVDTAHPEGLAEPPTEDGCPLAPGIVCTVAGTGIAGLGADGIPALESDLYWPQDVSFAPDGRGFVADWNNHRVRILEPDFVFSPLVGWGPPGDGPEGPADAALLNHPTGVAIDGDDVWVAGFHNARLLRVDVPTNTISFEVGTGVRGYGGDDGPAADALIAQPTSLTFDEDGSILWVDQGNQAIRRLRLDGMVELVAGTPGIAGSSGDGGPALDATFGAILSTYAAADMRLLRDGDRLYIADGFNHRVRVIDLVTGTIEAVAGDGVPLSSPDGTLPLDAHLNRPVDLALAPDGTLVVSEAGGHCVRALDPAGIRTLAGRCGEAGFEGDGGPADEALFHETAGITFDADGNLWVADLLNHRLRRVGATVP